MSRWTWNVSAALLLALPGAPSFGADASGAAASPASVPPAAPAIPEEIPEEEEPMVLEGGEEGTVFKSLQVTGEDLIRIEFARPELRVSLDPRTAPGLEWGDAEGTLKESGVDYTAPLLGVSTREGNPFAGRPWFDRYRTGSVARFTPKMEDVKRWSLTIADSRSDTLAVFSGEGEPPKEISWDGRARSGAPVPPGITCSYVLEAVDRAGNRRSFVGEGFVLPAYRLRTKTAEMLLFSGEELGPMGSMTSAGPTGAAGNAAPILLETASWLNQIEATGAPIEVKASAPTAAEATQLANHVVAALRPRVVGDPARIRAVADVRADVPARGTVVVTAGLAGAGPVAAAAPKAEKQAPAASEKKPAATVAPGAIAPAQVEAPAAETPKPEVKRVGSKYR